ncbi:MAG: amino acid racemase [Armatimonadetes bacterium]|nr:amino acid racemase [Armatimonadota bacterium]
MAEHIGIVGVSAEGAALCYRTICTDGAELMGRHAHPEVSMHTHPLSEYMRGIETGDWEDVGRLMLSSAQKLAGIGADFIACPDNTVHQSFDWVAERSPLPWLHIAEEVASDAEQRGFKRVGVLGTRYLMEGPVYAMKLSAIGIEHETPEQLERGRINQIIFDELVYGRFTESSRDYFSGVIRRLKDKGCDAVVLGCTEIPLLIGEGDSPLPTLDSTRILARAALRRATR